MPPFRSRLTPDLKDLAPYPDQERARRTLQRVDEARTYLLRRYGWYGDMAMRMQFVVSDQVETMSIRIDATCFVNPGFVEQLDLAELCFVVTHELWHVLGQHFDRLKTRDPDVWNRATDLFVNGRLVAAGMKLPTQPGLTGHYDSDLLHLSEEEIYSLLMERRASQPQLDDISQGEDRSPQSSGDNTTNPSKSQAPGDATVDTPEEQEHQIGDGGGSEKDDTEQEQPSERRSTKEGNNDAPSPVGFGTPGRDCDYAATDSLRRQSIEGMGRHVMTPTELTSAMAAAARRHQAAGRGDLPLGVELLIPGFVEPQMTLDDVLDQYLSVLPGTGTTYRRPNRRSAGLIGIPGLPAGTGIILPGAKERLDTVDVVLDTSGSRSMEDLAADVAMIETVLERYDYPVRVICGDAAVQTEQFIQDISELQFRGGGGTDAEPILRWIAENPGPNGTRLCIYFTDLEIAFPKEPPPFDVCWVYDGLGDPPPVPFGDVIVRPPIQAVTPSVICLNSRPLRNIRGPGF